MVKKSPKFLSMSPFHPVWVLAMWFHIDEAPYRFTVVLCAVVCGKKLRKLSSHVESHFLDVTHRLFLTQFHKYQVFTLKWKNMD